MLRFVFPRAPLGVLEKAWTERRMHSFAEQFGIQRLLAAEVITPDVRQLFADYHGTPEDAERILRHLSRAMQVDARNVRLQFVEDSCASGGHESAERGVISLAESQLGTPHALTASLVHGLAREALLGGSRMRGEEPEFPWVVDLFAIFVGQGLFAANATMLDNCTGGACTPTQTDPNRLPSRVVGYGLALFAWVREESHPKWSRWLRLDARRALQDGLRYLTRTGDSLFELSMINSRLEANSTNDLIRHLQSNSTSWKVAALWELADRPEDAPLAAEPVAACLRDKHPDLRSLAASTLKQFGPAAASYVPHLCHLLRDPHHEVRRQAAVALGVLRFVPEQAMPDLGEALDDSDSAVVIEAARALTAYGREAEPFVPRVLGALRQQCIQCSDANSRVLVRALHAMAADPTAATRECFRDFESEYMEYVLSLLGEVELGELANDLTSR